MIYHANDFGGGRLATIFFALLASFSAIASAVGPAIA
jgi:hypothetical protein